MADTPRRTDERKRLRVRWETASIRAREATMRGDPDAAAQRRHALDCLDDLRQTLEHAAQEGLLDPIDQAELAVFDARLMDARREQG